jgi:hypothetical protein
MSWLSTLGSDVKKVFGWLGSPKGQAILSAGEGLVETLDPALDGIVNLTNTWLQEIFKAESLATAASAGTGSGVQKAAIVLNSVTPQVLSFAASQGLPTPTGVDLQNANNALVAFLNALGAGTVAAQPIGAATKAPVQAVSTTYSAQIPVPSLIS